jgi:flagellar motor switch protein FliN/FliY
VSVVLGKTSKSIEDILDFTTGTVVILDKVVGDAVEVIANGKLIARGEVVAIEENYGVRITDIFSN